jgi:hypothetical protein
MNDLLKKLIKLYATHKVEELDNPNAGSLFLDSLKIPYQKLLADPLFKNMNNKVREYKVYLEDFEKRAINARAVMIDCLKFIYDSSVTEGAVKTEKFKEEIEIFQSLALATYDEKWSDPQKQYFIKIYKEFIGHNIYFISYTNRSVYPVNKLYKEIYEEVFKDEPIREEDLLQNNLLAKAFVKRLKQRNMQKGFFDDYSLRKSESNDKIIEEAKNTIALVQLISVASLTFSNQNWSFDEYNAYDVSRTKQSSIFFFTIEQNALPPIVHPRYTRWRDRINTTNQYPNFFTVQTPGEFYTIIDNLINNINAVNYDLADAVPN